MSTIWKMVDGTKLKKSTKNTIFLLTLILISLVVGGILWLMLGRLILPGRQWLLCFMGYPAMFIGLFGGIYYLFNHDFS